MADSIFAELGMKEVHSTTLATELANAGDALVCVFCWGVDCYNCDVAKKAMQQRPDALAELNLSWFHANVYADRDLALKLSLHGIPVFAFYHRGKKIGVATGWHGFAQFEAAVQNARKKIAAAT